MARGINKAILIGNLGADPEIRYIPNGSAVTNMNLATSTVWKDKSTGESNEKTEWHRLVCFGRLAEIATEYLRKGSKIYIEGRIQTRKWQDRNGMDRYTTEIICNDMQMLDKKENVSNFESSANKHSSIESNNETNPKPKSTEESMDFDTGEMDDIPF